MYVSSSRRHLRRAGPPDPIQTETQSNSAGTTGSGSEPWSPAQPTPPTAQSTEFHTFPVSPESATDGGFSPAGSAPTATAAARRESVESRTGAVPQTPISTPTERNGSAGEWGSIDELLAAARSGRWSPKSPRWRLGRSGSSRNMVGVEEREGEAGGGGSGARGVVVRSHGAGGDGWPRPWWKYLWIVGTLVLLMLSVPGLRVAF
ncbi:hypothetical protein EsH8_IV_000091 [Colletotrichum jinshuiense]